MKTISSIHGELLNIAVALTAGSVALFMSEGSKEVSGVTFALLGSAAIFAVLGIIIYRRHASDVKAANEDEIQLQRDREKIREVPQIDGQWEYSVKNTSASGKKMHTGTCNVKRGVAGPRSFKLYGTRKEMWDPKDDAKTECDLDWETSWCEFTDTGQIKLTYHIEVDNEKLDGYATLNFNGNHPDELKGQYALHGPDGNLRTRGTITFTRTK